MALSKTLIGLLFLGAVTAGGACSASKGSTGNETQPGMTNGYAAAPPSFGATNPFLPPPGPNGQGGGGPIFGGGLSGSGTQVLPGLDGGACPAIKQTPETITVYRDASVTDTITTYKPVCLFIMQDRSSSMVGVTGDPQSWNNSTTAITAFVNDPRSAGIDIGLGVFPPMQFTDNNNQGDCATGSDCGQQLVPIAPLPGNGQAMINGYNTANPGAATGALFLTPTECALRGMINTTLSFMAQSPIGEQCVAILVTDGAPTRCNQDHAALVQIVAEGHSRGVTTFTLGLPGADLNFLNELANAGGTNASIDVTGGADSFINALNNIRQAVAVTTTTVVSTPMVISTPLPCQWKIPPIQGVGQTFDPTKVNVQFTPPGGAPNQFGYVNSAADCARTNGDAWYYDNPNAPTQVIACPQTCNGTLKNSAGAQVEVLFGCARKPADIH